MSSWPAGNLIFEWSHDLVKNGVLLISLGFWFSIDFSLVFKIWDSLLKGVLWFLEDDDGLSLLTESSLDLLNYINYCLQWHIYQHRGPFSRTQIRGGWLQPLMMRASWRVTKQLRFGSFQGCGVTLRPWFEDRQGLGRVVGEEFLFSFLGLKVLPLILNLRMMSLILQLIEGRLGLRWRG